MDGPNVAALASKSWKLYRTPGVSPVTVVPVPVPAYRTLFPLPTSGDVEKSAIHKQAKVFLDCLESSGVY